MGGSHKHTHSEASAKTNVYTHVHNFIHRLIHSPSRAAAQNHTCTETLIDILRAGGLGISQVFGAGVWHGVGVVLCAGAGVRHSITLPGPHPPLGHARQRARGGGMYRARCVAYAVVLWCRRGVVVVVLGLSGLVCAGMVRAGQGVGRLSVCAWVALWVCWVIWWA